MRTSSERHANKLLDEKTGTQLFPSAPTISVKMWKKVQSVKMWKKLQSFDTQRLLHSHVEGSAEYCKQWLENMEWFVPTELELNAPFSDLIAGFHNHGTMPVVPCRQYLTAIAEVWSCCRTIITSI
jgi:hypothetical protein